MAYWKKDNAGSYRCSACGYECNNPNGLPGGPGECLRCHAKMSVQKQHKSLGGAGTNEHPVVMQHTSDAAPLGYCPFSKHPCGSACALFNANLKRCGILAALEMR